MINLWRRQMRKRGDFSLGVYLILENWGNWQQEMEEKPMEEDWENPGNQEKVFQVGENN